MEPSEDRSLFARIHAGPRGAARDALRELYVRHAPAVLGFLRRMLNDADADDLLQETFLAAARNAGRFRRGSALPWLLTIAARRASDHLRGARRRRGYEAQAGPREASGERDSNALAAALERLDTRTRVVLELRFVDELTHAAVADVLGVSLRTAKTWAADALEALRAELERER